MLSFAFVYAASTVGLFFVVLTSVIVYLAAKKIEKVDDDRKKKVLIAAMGACLFILIFLKYLSGLSIFTQGNLMIFGNEMTILGVIKKYLLPIGMSYYTLQVISYLLDVYWGRLEAEQDYWKVLLFTCFFPQLVQGPISKYSELAPELFKEHKLDWKNIKYKGCSSVIIPKEYFMEPNRLFDYMNEHKVTSVGWSVSAFTVALSLGAFEEVKLNTLKKICFSGSVMPASCLSVWQQNLPDAKFVNQYGPTEATASCTYYEVNHLVSQDEQLPIGIPYNNYRVFLLNEDLTETQNGEIGEICVSGPILALGYYNDPERTEKSFIINPNYKGYPERMYRTGDYGRIREDGLLEFHGRMDRQVKHMGHRVELDEIEYAANQIAGVDECVSLYNKEKEVLYLFYSGETAMRQVVLELRKVLPGFMVPRKVKQVSALPKLASGKIDMTTLKEEM